MAWNAVLVVYASKGFSISSHFVYQFFWCNNIFQSSFDRQSKNCRISFARTTLESCCGKYLVLKLQLCASLASLNRKKSCGTLSNMQVTCCLLSLLWLWNFTLVDGSMVPLKGVTFVYGSCLLCFKYQFKVSFNFSVVKFLFLFKSSYIQHFIIEFPTWNTFNHSYRMFGFLVLAYFMPNFIALFYKWLHVFVHFWPELYLRWEVQLLEVELLHQDFAQVKMAYQADFKRNGSF